MNGYEKYAFFNGKPAMGTYLGNGERYGQGYY